MSEQPTTPMAVPRTVLVAVTACEGGVVVVQPPKGSPRVVQGETARVLHELAMDPTLPSHTSEPGANTIDRVCSLAERLFGVGAASDGA